METLLSLSVAPAFGPVTVGFSSLLVCMMPGTVFCNICDFSAEIMEKTDKRTAPR